MIVTHDGISYECATAVKCEDDKYIKLFNEAGAEIASFNHISDFTAYTASGGAWIAPCDCSKPIPVSGHAIGKHTIRKEDWILKENNKFYYEIQNDLISANTTTCDILLNFAPGTEFEYSATQEAGKIIFAVNTRPDADITINSMRITCAIR